MPIREAASSPQYTAPAQACAVGDDALQAILAAAHCAPLSMNAEFLSVVVIRDAARRAQIAQASIVHDNIANAPVFLCIVADFKKAATILQSEEDAEWLFDSREGFAAVAVDAGLLLAELGTHCRRMGLRTTLVDGVRLNPHALIALLELPPGVFPVVGCSIFGARNEATQRPLLPIHTFCHHERWQQVPTMQEIDAYNRELEAYMERR